MPSLPLPALSIKGAKAREYKAFDGGEHNSLPSTFSDPTASASTHANVGHGDPASTGGVGEAYPTACASAHRPSWGPQGARHSSFGIGNEGLDRSRRGDQEGRGCCRRMTSFQISYLVVMLASMFYFISDALGSRRVLLWLEGILVSTHPQTAGMTTALLLSLGSVMVALGFPTTFLALLGGHVYSNLLTGALPILVTSLVVTAAASLGCFLAFRLTRSVLRDVASESLHSHPRLGALDAVLGEQGLRLNLLLRLCPVVPYSFLNFAMGLTAARSEDFVLGCLVGILPAVILLAYVGVAEGGGKGAGEILESFGRRHPMETRAALGSGALLLVIAGWIVWRAARSKARAEEIRKQSVVDSMGWEM